MTRGSSFITAGIVPHSSVVSSLGCAVRTYRCARGLRWGAPQGGSWGSVVSFKLGVKECWILFLRYSNSGFSAGSIVEEGTATSRDARQWTKAPE